MSKVYCTVADGQLVSLVSVTDNCPVPRSGTFQEVRTYECASQLRVKTIVVSNFQGRYSDWNEFVERQPWDDEKSNVKETKTLKEQRC